MSVKCFIRSLVRLYVIRKCIITFLVNPLVPPIAIHVTYNHYMVLHPSYTCIYIYIYYTLYTTHVLKQYIITVITCVCVFGSCRCSCGIINKLQDCQLGRALLQLSKLRVKWTNQINRNMMFIPSVYVLAAITHSRIDRETFPSVYSNDFQNTYMYI